MGYFPNYFDFDPRWHGCHPARFGHLALIVVWGWCYDVFGRRPLGLFRLSHRNGCGWHCRDFSKPRTNMAIAKRLSVSSDRHILGPCIRSVGRRLSHHPVKNCPWFGRLGWAWFNARHADASEFPSRKTYRFHFHDTGRRIGFHWGHVFIVHLSPDPCVLLDFSCAK